MRYPITEIFHSLQGEGHFVGYPMTFVRLAGCGVLDCHIRAECDEAPWRASFSASEGEIVDRVRSLKQSGIVCLTGGEPADHDTIPLVEALRGARYRVHMETSGSRPLTGLSIEWLTVSPKVWSADGLKQRTGHALKIVVRSEWTPQEAWDLITGIDVDTQFFHRYLQPTTIHGEPANLATVVEMLTGDGHNAGGRWALSFQAHRVWKIK